jgi:hypothetical protein
LTLAAQQAPVRRIAHQSMPELKCRVRRRTVSEQQTSRNKTVERRSQLCLGLGHNRSQQGMRELPPDSRPYLRDLLGWPEPVKPRHQRRLQACRDCQGG